MGSLDYSTDSVPSCIDITTKSAPYLTFIQFNGLDYIITPNCDKYNNISIQEKDKTFSLTTFTVCCIVYSTKKTGVCASSNLLRFTAGARGAYMADKKIPDQIIKLCCVH